MRTIVHLSDLHFGRVDPTVVTALADCVHQLAPHVVALSGDLTQRARARQFREARAFLDSLPRPQIVVPGNHDVPMFNAIARVIDPLGGFRRYVTSDLHPFYANDEVAVAGLNTTRSFTIKGGRARAADVQRVCERFQQLSDIVVKVVVAHHPFEAAQHVARGRWRGSGRGTVEALTRGGADVFLTGHLHVSYTGATAARYNIGGRAAVVVEAGTATSTRMRGEANAFNVLRLDARSIVVERFEWRQASRGFDVGEVRRFERTPNGWVPAATTT